MFCSCCVHVVFMLCSCCVYVVFILCSCCVHVVFMLCSCCVHAWRNCWNSTYIVVYCTDCIGTNCWFLATPYIHPISPISLKTWRNKNMYSDIFWLHIPELISCWDALASGKFLNSDRPIYRQTHFQKWSCLGLDLLTSLRVSFMWSPIIPQKLSSLRRKEIKIEQYWREHH